MLEYIYVYISFILFYLHFLLCPAGFKPSLMSVKIVSNELYSATLVDDTLLGSLVSEVFFSWISCPSKAREHSQLYYFFIGRWERDGFMPFLKGLASSEKQTSLSRIWTCLTKSIFFKGKMIFIFEIYSPDLYLFAWHFLSISVDESTIGCDDHLGIFRSSHRLSPNLGPWRLLPLSLFFLLLLDWLASHSYMLHTKKKKVDWVSVSQIGGEEIV